VTLPVGFGAGYSIWLRFTKAYASNIADDMLLATPSGESMELLNALEPPAASPKKQEKNHNQQNEAETAPAIIANAGTHVVAAAAKDE
jgi:hypothetical protein